MANSPSAAIRSSPSDVDALLDLIKRKPPPKVDGLVHFASDLRKQFSAEERHAMLASESGEKLAAALSRCEGIQKQMRNSSNDWIKNKENKMKRKKAEEDRNKYVECLTYFACPSRWKQYTQCWSSLSKLQMSQLKRLQQFGPELACKYERQLLEQCVGSLVSSAIRAADDAKPVDAWDMDSDF
jgi:hypothetical protein